MFELPLLNGVYAGTVGTSLGIGAYGSDTLVIVTFNPALADLDCWTIDLTGMIGLETSLGILDSSVGILTVKGDVNRDGTVSTADASVIKPKFGEIPDSSTAQFDFNSDGIVSTADFSQVKPLFGAGAAGCP